MATELVIGSLRNVHVNPVTACREEPTSQHGIHPQIYVFVKPQVWGLYPQEHSDSLLLIGKHIPSNGKLLYFILLHIIIQCN